MNRTTFKQLAILPLFAALALGSSSPSSSSSTTKDGGGALALPGSGAASTSAFQTIEIGRPTSEDTKLKIDVPVGTQIKPSSRTTVLQKGDGFAVDITAEKQTIAEVKEIMAGATSGWSNVKIVKDTPNVVVFKGDYLGKSRTRIHSSVSPKGFFTTCSNEVTAMTDSAAIDDMIRTCESFAANAGGAAPPAPEKKAAGPGPALKTASKSSPKKP